MYIYYTVAENKNHSCIKLMAFFLDLQESKLISW